MNRNGAIRSGLFCTASHLLGSFTVDQYVDVFHSAQHVRNKRPQAIDCVVRFSLVLLMYVSVSCIHGICGEEVTVIINYLFDKKGGVHLLGHNIMLNRSNTVYLANCHCPSWVADGC